jgi:hypothetical protein
MGDARLQIKCGLAGCQVDAAPLRASGAVARTRRRRAGSQTSVRGGDAQWLAAQAAGCCAGRQQGRGVEEYGRRYVGLWAAVVRWCSGKKQSSAPDSADQQVIMRQVRGWTGHSRESGEGRGCTGAESWRVRMRAGNKTWKVCKSERCACPICPYLWPHTGSCSEESYSRRRKAVDGVRSFTSLQTWCSPIAPRASPGPTQAAPYRLQQPLEPETPA